LIPEGGSQIASDPESIAANITWSLCGTTEDLDFDVVIQFVGIIAFAIQPNISGQRSLGIDQPALRGFDLIHILNDLELKQRGRSTPNPSAPAMTCWVTDLIVNL
jgi:hypothetical protein